MMSDDSRSRTMADDPHMSSVAPDGRPAEAQPQWRRDFAIDWPEDAYIARRDFTKFLVLTSVAFATGQFWIVARSATGSREESTAPLAVARTDTLPVGGAKPFAYPGPGDPCLLVRVDESTFVAFSQRCTHLSCAVVPQPEHNRFYCPCHEGVFDLRSGRPIAGPPRRPLPLVALEVRNGVVYATGFQERTQ